MIEILHTDIFSVKAEALVSPANCQADLGCGSHISEKVKKLAGQDVQAERKRQGPIRLGQAAITSGGCSDAVVVRWRRNWPNDVRG